MDALELEDARIEALVSLIKDSFRVRENQDPIYVDVSGNLARVSATQHQVIYGRRGSGKSCLLVHFHRREARDRDIFTVYIESDEIKRLGYPDILIRILLTITERLPGRRRGRLARLLRRRPTPLEVQATELRALLDLADESDVVEEAKRSEQTKAEARAGEGGVTAGVSYGSSESVGRTSKFREEKLDRLERHFQDYKNVISEALRGSRFRSGAVIVDDFYLVHRTVQPDVIDYLHRLLRGTDLYLKLGTVRHRTTLMRHAGQSIGENDGLHWPRRDGSQLASSSVRTSRRSASTGHLRTSTPHRSSCS